LHSAIPADDLALFGVDPWSLLFDRILAVRGGLDVWLDWLQSIYLAQEPLADLTFPGIMRSHLATIVINDFPDTSMGISTPILERAMTVVTPKDWHRAYHDNQTPVSGILRACLFCDVYWTQIQPRLPDLDRFLPIRCRSHFKREPLK
jgi:hypothetical protein